MTEGFFDSIGDDFNEGQRDLGAAMMVTGTVLVLLGLVAESHRSNDDAAMAPVTYAPMQRTLSAPGATAYIVPYEPPVARRASPAELAMRSRLENRLALQASSAARRGDCAGAVASSVKLAEVDPVMHAELVRADADLADCLARVAAQN